MRWGLGAKREEGREGKEGNNRLVLKTATAAVRCEVLPTNTDKDRSQSFPLTVLHKRERAVKQHSEGFCLVKGTFSCRSSLVGGQVSAISLCKVEQN